MIKKITWEEILPIWQEKLWPSDVRTSPIEPTSAMCLSLVWGVNDKGEKDLIQQYDLENMKSTPTFWGYFIDNKLVGVNSGHMCIGKEYRSRGLWVDPTYRGIGIGKKLLIKTIAQGYHEGAVLCWSYPRFESWSAYTSAGFINKSNEYWFDWEKSETGMNCRCFIIL